MDPQLQEKIIETDKLNLNWTQKFVIPQGDTTIDLSPACRKDGVSPAGAINQPAQYFGPTVYWFDTHRFKGEESWPELRKFLEENLEGAKFVTNRGPKTQVGKKKYFLCCNQCVLSRSSDKFESSQNYAQYGVRKETVKQTKSKGELSSFDKMGSKKEQKIAKSKSSSKEPTHPTNYRTTTESPTDAVNLCKCKITIILSSKGEFFLDKNMTNLQHTGHRYLPPTAQKIPESNVSDEHSALIQKMSALGIKPHKIAQLLDVLEENDAIYSAKTVKNIIQKHEHIKNAALGITNDMTSAEKSIQYLKEWVIVYFLGHRI